MPYAAHCQRLSSYEQQIFYLMLPWQTSASLHHPVGGFERTLQTGSAILYPIRYRFLAKDDLVGTGEQPGQSPNRRSRLLSNHSQFVRAVFEDVQPYHTYIPSFGDWGFIIGRHGGNENQINLDALPGDLKFLSTNQIEQAFIFPKDISIADTKQNTLDNPIILNYFLDEWAKWKVDFESGTN